MADSDRVADPLVKGRGGKGKGRSGRGGSGSGKGRGGAKGKGGSGGGRGKGKGTGRRSGSGRGAGGAGADLRTRVTEALAASPRGPLKTKELARALDIPTHEYRSFRDLLESMERDGRVVRIRGRRYALPAKLDLVTGTLSVTRDGHGFVRPEDTGEDVYVPRHRLDNAMDGDRVVTRIERRPEGRNREGSVIRVIERARETIVGTLHRGARVTYVVPLDVRLNQDVLISTSGDDVEADDGDIVVVRVTSYGEGRVGPAGTIDEVLGPINAPGVDVLAVAHGFGIALEFPADLRDAAARAAKDGVDDPGPDRVDRTDLLTFTIDPADAKDHDDALSVQRVDGGLVEVGVHIADVSHFVRPDTPVDIEAAARGTSVYLVDRTVPMLPPVLSNDVCSLNPREPKFAVSVFVRLDGQGRVTDRRYERTVIECAHALSYEEAQEVLDGQGSVDDEVDDALRLLDDTARNVRARRRDRGSLDLDLPEAKVILDTEGRPVDIRRRERKESHRLIEDFMILANEVVANDMEARDLTTMYRVHERPPREKIEALAETLASFGLKLASRKSIHPSHVQALLDAVRGRDEEALVSNLVLRSMAKARYHTDNLGHFGLASEGYLHFTSPIRRYPDLVAHRVLTQVLVHGRKEPYLDRPALSRLADQCSARERAAEEAERASVAMKKVEFMEQHLGEEFPGRISGVAAFGFFVTLKTYFVDGLVHVSSLQDDFYHFQERDHALVGERGGRRFRLGDEVQVQVARVDKEARHVDFVILGNR
ncbi:MAG: ribonuclease R [Gemmatimonadota bacterium]|nr:ribonuclease R [Gemmatimonadota bacterium]